METDIICLSSILLLFSSATFIGGGATSLTGEVQGLSYMLRATAWLGSDWPQ
jgi:heme/copper-type cytochrome/quinol oxidase subunit 3